MCVLSQFLIEKFKKQKNIKNFRNRIKAYKIRVKERKHLHTTV